MHKILKLADNIHLLNLGSMDSNVYVINKDTLIDSSSGMHPEFLKKGLQQLGIDMQNIKQVINTHHHVEHVGGNSLFHNAKKMMHKKSLEIWKKNDEVKTHAIMFPHSFGEIKADVLLEHNNSINIGGTILKILQSPDNEDGHICIYDSKRGFLFSGDTNIELVASLNLDLSKILPAHGKPIDVETEKPI